MFLNTLLLFVILFYVYPLKYMFTLFTDGHPRPARGACRRAGRRFSSRSTASA